MDKIFIYCPSIRKDFFNEMSKSVYPINTLYIDGSNAKCLSELFNKIIMQCQSDIVIIANDKARPKPSDCEHMINLIKEGYGFVGLYRFGFFGFHKKIIQKVGFFDERFITAGYEDNDFYTRLKIHDIAYYLSEEINYINNIPTLWNHSRSKNFFYEKYTIDHDKKIIYKNHEEDKLSYSINEKFDYCYKSWKESVVKCIVPLEFMLIDFSKFLKDYEIKIK